MMSSEESGHVRRRLLRDGAIIIAAAAIAAIGSAGAQWSRASAPWIMPGTDTSFGQLKQIDTGLLNVGCVQAGPADGPAALEGDANGFAR